MRLVVNEIIPDLLHILGLHSQQISVEYDDDNDDGGGDDHECGSVCPHEGTFAGSCACVRRAVSWMFGERSQKTEFHLGIRELDPRKFDTMRVKVGGRGRPWANICA